MRKIQLLTALVCSLALPPTAIMAAAPPASVAAVQRLLAAQADGQYAVNFAADAKITYADRSTKSVTLTRADGTEQTVTIDQPTSRLLYFDKTAEVFKARAGETVTPSIGFTQGDKWMHGYVYLDRGNDGVFSTDLNADGTPTGTSDLMAYTYYQGKNSQGQSLKSGETGVNPAAFTVPADLKAGTYRLRFKVDWDDTDPAGSTVEGNTILKNGGVIVDVTLQVEARLVTDYPINFDPYAKITHAARSTSSASLTRADGTVQTIAVDQPSSKRLFFDKTDQSFQAKPGEKVTPSLAYNGGYMHGYLYLDRNHDGAFSDSLNADGTPAAVSDVMAYTYYKGKNSLGQKLTSDNPGANPPAFTVPADLKPGFYRMRYKIDWDDIDPAGSTAAGNTILKNGGVIIDTKLNVHEDQVALTIASYTGGTVTLADGSALADKIAFGEPIALKLTPADGYRLSGLTVRHGYELDGESTVHATPQYTEVSYPSYLIPADGTLTLPASLIDGNVLLTPVFVEDEPATGHDYARSFADDLAVARTDCSFTAFTLSATKGGSRTITVPAATPNLVYRPLLTQEASAVPGDVVYLTTDYTKGGEKHYMHLYLYVDLNQDGHFNNTVDAEGKPVIDGEMVSYTYYKGHNSLGAAIDNPDAVSTASMPAFTVPANLPCGVYRARLKVDWDDISPAGRWAEGAMNNIEANGGQIIDFLLNVHPLTGSLSILTTDGSVVGAGNTGVADKTTFGQPLRLLPVGATADYEAETITIRHGFDLNGPQYVHGNRQWSEYTVPGNAAFTIPADSVNGDVCVTANFTADATATYVRTFADEFNLPDGSQPDSKYWSRSSRENPTWKRFVAQTEAGQKQTGYIEDGKFVALCMPNTLDDELDGNGNKQQMISASIESRYKVDVLYGKIEGRLKTDPYSGNFPAFWMMPTDQSDGWPYCGEIDIWEQIDAQNISHHTIHTRWANGKADGELCQGQSNNPAKSGQANTTNGVYHTYGLEWTPTILKWFVDGKQVFSYAKKENDANALSLGQWPFDKSFYIILNQSVGNGSWAAPADVNHTYRTLFDWVRVYQTDQQTGLVEAAADEKADVYTRPGSLVISAPKAMPLSVYDLQGRTVYKETVQGNVTLSLPQGVYLVGGQKVLVP